MTSTQQDARPEDNAEEALLLESNTASPLRIVSIVALAAAIGSFGLAAIIMDGDVQVGNGISATERMGWAGVLLVVMVGFLVGVSMYQRRVATRIVLLAGGQRLRITSPTLFGQSTDEIRLSDVEESQYHDGDKAGEEATNTPWLYLRIKGKRSFVVPLGSNIPNKERLLKLLSVTR